MQNVMFTGTGIRIGGQDYPLWSGSFHYWRSDPDDWESILEKIAGMGFLMVESYIPWGVHELKKGKYDFGSVDPSKNLVRFLECCKKQGLFVFLRPGPHINAELDCFGFPERIVFNPAYMARTPYGTPVTYPYATRPFPVPSYASPAFLEEVWEYFDAVYEQVADYFYPNGPVVALQSDNEFCHFFRDSVYCLDYSEASVSAYHTFLQKRYGTLQRLSEAHGIQYAAFGDVKAPVGFSGGEIAKYYDWVCFKEQQITGTVKKITQYWRGKGVKLPVYHNIAFQYYTPVDLVALEREAVDLAGMDIYLYQNEGEDIRRKMRYLSGTSKLAYVPEFISGVWFDNPATPTVAEQRFVTLYALMNGLKAVNFYMTVERDRWQGCPVTADGRIRKEYYDFFSSLNQFVMDYGLHKSTRSPGILLLRNYERGRYLSMYSRADLSPMVSNAFVKGLEAPRSLFAPESGTGPAFLQEAVKHWGEDGWIDGIARHLTSRGVDYNISDSQLPLEEMQKYSTIYATCFQYMSGELQQKLLDYAKTGGRLILSCLPGQDAARERCTILADALSGGRQLQISVDEGSHDVTEQRMLTPQGDSPLEYMLHHTEKGPLLFVANPTGMTGAGTVLLLERAKLGNPVWVENGTSASCDHSLAAFTLPPYTVAVWEVVS